MQHSGENRYDPGMATSLSGDKLIQAALAYATQAFEGVVDKQGVPYIEHCKAVANGVDSPTLKAAALLHDVIEDTATTADELLHHGFSASVVTLVEAVTRRDNETYEEFIYRVKKSGPDAVALKLADIGHNTDLTRGPLPLSLAKRYAKARLILVHPAMSEVD